MKLAKDCQMLSRSQGSGLTSADLEVIFAKEVQTKKKSNSSSLAKRQNVRGVPVPPIDMILVPTLKSANSRLLPALPPPPSLSPPS